MEEEKQKKKRKKKETGGERKPNWKEYMATVEDIQNFLMDRILLRHNVITKRVEYRVPLSSSVANEGFAPLCGAAATPVAALKTPVASREGGGRYWVHVQV